MVQGKTVLITGGSRGIGAAMVRIFAEHGANVAFTYRSSEERALELANSIEGVQCKAYKSDASKLEEAEKLMADVLNDFGGIDVLINNAGITRDNLLMRMTEDQWDQVMDNNLKSIFNLCKQAIRPMMKNRNGSIINIGSVVGIFGNKGQTNYSASKAGMIGFSKSLAKELGSRNIRCNVIAPGFITTEMTGELTEEQEKYYKQIIPVGRFGTGEDIANACLFLASDMGAYVNGQVISVCGGMNM